MIKCERCPFYWTDGMYSEIGCYVEEGKYGKILEKMLQIETKESCIIPLWILKLIFNIHYKIDKMRFMKEEAEYAGK